MLYWLIGMIFVFVICVSIFFVTKKRNIFDNSEDKNVISQDRINIIKEKYKAIEKIKKMKRPTKEDVDEFYKSQSEQN